MKKTTNFARVFVISPLVFSSVLALLFVFLLMFGLQATMPAHADPGDRYVDGASGQDDSTCGTAIAPCQTISYTLNTRANEGDTILIASGIYTENLTITGITVTLRGNYTNAGSEWLADSAETVINGDQKGRTLAIYDSNTVLENLTITGGQAPSAQCWGSGVWVTNGNVIIRSSKITANTSECGAAGIEVNDDFGLAYLSLISSTVSYNVGNQHGGMQVYGGNASALVQNVVFFANTAQDSGGGIAVVNNAYADIVDTAIYSNSVNNHGGGLVIRDGGSADISESKIYSNTAISGNGGGISVHEASLDLSKSSLTENNAPNGQSGGIDVGDNSMVTIVDSDIANNTTDLHGGAATISSGAQFTLTNVLVTNNSTTSGNANAFAISGNMNILNSTVSDNNPQTAQAVILWSGYLTITNSIFWNNALNLQADPPCPTCFIVTYSDIEGGWTGTGNINEDPLFVATDDYRLQKDSPCIDTATNTGTPDHDLEQNPRPQDGDLDGIAITDMGAYEFTFIRNYLPLTIGNPTE